LAPHRLSLLIRSSPGINAANCLYNHNGYADTYGPAYPRSIGGWTYHVSPRSWLDSGLSREWRLLGYTHQSALKERTHLCDVKGDPILPVRQGRLPQPSCRLAAPAQQCETCRRLTLRLHRGGI